MHLTIISELDSLNLWAAEHAARVLRGAIDLLGRARLVAATGSSQIALLEHLTAAPDIDWSKVELFHLDEYIGLGSAHPASFCRFLRERLINKSGITRAHLLDGLAEPRAVIQEVGSALRAEPIDLLLAGIGENGHLAFNEPPADFANPAPYFVVTLDEVSRRQQVGEGWFARIEDVPTAAITMSISQILQAREIVCVVHGRRKARAVHACFAGGVTPDAPASVLRTHELATVYLDSEAASALPASRGGLAPG
jgi:glucosamine-6-phosphate deaminase